MTRRSDLLSRRRPIIRWGQSNIAGGYRPIADWPGRLQFEQDAIHCYNLFCHHQEASPTGAYARNDTWHRIAPWQMGTSSGPAPVSGQFTGNWGLDLADGLLGRGVNAALLDYCVGGTQLEYWVPGATGTNYPTILAWTQARLAELDSPLDPVLVFYQGESGTAGLNWTTGMQTLAARIRSDLGVASLGIVVVQLPSTYTPGASVAAAQATYVASDARARLAFCHDTTFVTDPGPSALHIDTASGRRLAVGPENGATVRSVLSRILELI